MIYSVENPVEKVLSSISQIEIDPKRNMSFQTVLKMLLRMDPDVIFV
jgi:transformation system protein ctsE